MIVRNRGAATILVIEDDKSLREGLAMNFQLHGYNAVTAADGDEGMRAVWESKPDLIVLDIMLPGRSGLEILDELRDVTQEIPVLILSARDRTSDKIEGLKIGADDYVTKPFELPELLARVEAILRRRLAERRAEPAIVFGDVEIDPQGRKVRKRNKEIQLSAKEFDLLLLLARSQGKPLTRDKILNSVWSANFEGTSRTVDNFIASLRHKIEADPARPKYIKTVRQVGYKLEV